MPVYQYKAVSASGESLSGSYTANSKNDVSAMLRKSNYYPVTIQAEPENNIRAMKFFSSVGLKDIAVFCRQFYTMLNAGITILNALEILRHQLEKPKLREITNNLYEEVQKGLNFSQALKQHPDTFPELFIYMVEAGESSGSLDVMMARLSDHYEKENKIRNKIKGAMVYPIILSIVAIAVVVFLLTFVMPTFIGMFEGSGVPLPAPTRLLMAFSNSIRTHWYIHLLVLIGIVYSFKRVISTDSGRMSYDKIKLQLPIIKGVNQKIITARFTRTLSTLLYSGIPLLQALENVSNVVGNRVVAEEILKAKDEVRKGVDLSTPIKKTGVFPPMVDSMIKIGEESGSLDEILEKTANFYDDEVDVALQKMVTMFEPLMIVVMGVIIGFIVIAMMLPMFDMMNTVQ